MDQAATAAGVNVATLYRWQHNPEFQEALHQARAEWRREALAQDTGRRAQDVILAKATLREIMTNPDLPAGARVQAAKCLIAQPSPELDHTRDTFKGISSLTDAELEQIILGGKAKRLEATDTQQTEKPQIDKAPAVELPPAGPSPNTVPPPISTSSRGTAAPTWRSPSSNDSR